MERTEQFKFNLMDKVIIREIQRPGVVEAMMIDGLGVQYRVAFWDNSKREYAWMPAEELNPR